MSDAASATLQPNSAIAADDPNRNLTVADPDSSMVRHVAVVGGTYSILVSGAQTAGRYCLIDMIVPDGSGPPLHRHDFEEMFALLEGEQFTFRGETTTVRAGSSVNIPANAPHVFKNTSGSTVHMLCMCTPAGQEEFLVEVGDPLDSRTSQLPKLDKAGMEERMKRAKALAPKYHTELLTS
jgi:mannose-6-phosphate isomerase-like protein (cupin superfamily)